VVTQVGERLVV